MWPVGTGNNEGWEEDLRREVIPFVFFWGGRGDIKQMRISKMNKWREELVLQYMVEYKRICRLSLL